MKDRDGTNKESHIFQHVYVFKFIFFSIMGVLIFFVPFTISGSRTIPLDHLTTYITKTVPSFAPAFTLLMCIAGGILPFINKTWKKNTTNAIFSILKFLGIFAGLMAYLKIGPDWLLQEDMLPFLFIRVVIPVTLVIPLGALFLTCLTDYGLMEFLGVLMRPIMRPVWHVPGKAAINAVTSFVGNFSVGIFMTNRLLKEGKFTLKEASIIMTGFSTVSAAFMVIVARTLGLMEMWNTFFWSTLIITFLITAVTVRLKPLRSIEDVYITEEGDPEPEYDGSIVKNALKEGLGVAKQAKPLRENMRRNFKDGVAMCMSLAPTIISIGLISLILVKKTPIFDFLAYVYYPFALLLGVSDPMQVAQASAVVGAEMFIPSALVAGTNAALASKYVVGVVSISAILFFSGSIPCIIATEAKLSMKNLVIILIERTVLAIIFAALFSKIVF